MNTTAQQPNAQPTNERLSHELVRDLTVGAMRGAINEGDASFMMVPPGYRLEEITKQIEAAQLLRNRKQGEVRLASIDSLLAYIGDAAAQEYGYIYASPDHRTIVAVLNDQRSATDAGWRDWRATFKAEHTPEFERWLANSGAAKAKGQTEFAEFMEDNLADITEPAAHTLLDVATTIQAKTDIAFSSAKRLQDGQVQLGYTETIDARAGANGALTIPREFTLGLRVFKNGDGYTQRARLKYRLGGGGVKFWYELDRPERTIEAAFQGYIDKLREHSGYVVLIGQP